MADTERFGVSMDGDLLAAFDQRIEQAGYPNRSEAIRDLVRDYLVEQRIQAPDAHVIGTVTIMYDHHSRLLGERLTDLQHDHHDAIRCTTHVHLDAHNCVEVIVLSGTSAQVREIAEGLISTRGVQHGRLVMTAPQ
ncbi:nickel-responsive transcriptional regulator NikR [bacterium]|nr:nickel-responsive transcriptional regulator NikR [bacterium]